jgi:hypothetical protein
MVCHFVTVILVIRIFIHSFIHFSAGKPVTQESSLDVFCHVIFDVNIDVMDVRGRTKDVFCCQTGSRSLEGPFYESLFFWKWKYRCKISTFTFPNVRRNDPFNKILQITIIEAIKQQIPEAVLWRPSCQYLRRKSRDKKRQVELFCVTGFPTDYA